MCWTFYSAKLGYNQSQIFLSPRKKGCQKDTRKLPQPFNSPTNLSPLGRRVTLERQMEVQSFDWIIGTAQFLSCCLQYFCRLDKITLLPSGLTAMLYPTLSSDSELQIFNVSAFVCLTPSSQGKILMQRSMWTLYPPVQGSTQIRHRIQSQIFFHRVHVDRCIKSELKPKLKQLEALRRW
jgi:hypothetical protein